MTPQEIFTNPIVVAAATLLLSKLPSFVISQFSSAKKFRYRHGREVFKKFYLPLYKEMYEHDFFPNPTYQDMLSFISTSKKLIEDNFVLIPSAVLGKILGLESKIMKLNYNTSDKVKENRLKMRFTEYTNLLKSKYFDFRRKLYYADVSLREELNAFSTIKSAIFAIYIFAVIAGGLDAIIISITHAVTPGATLIAVMSAVIIIALIIVMDRLNK